MVETPTTSEHSSPGSLVSDSGSLSPTSIESLSLGPALMRERERAREEAQVTFTTSNRSNNLERTRGEAQLTLTTLNDSRASGPARPRYEPKRSFGPAWKARRTRLTQSMHLDDEKFLDFDDI